MSRHGSGLSYRFGLSPSALGRSQTECKGDFAFTFVQVQLHSFQDDSFCRRPFLDTGNFNMQSGHYHFVWQEAGPAPEDAPLVAGSKAQTVSWKLLAETEQLN